eukprot:m51a1_g12061 hypothetical protein (418) ;mRNA; f:130-1557
MLPLDDAERLVLDKCLDKDRSLLSVQLKTATLLSLGEYSQANDLVPELERITGASTALRHLDEQSRDKVLLQRNALALYSAALPEAVLRQRVPQPLQLQQQQGAAAAAMGASLSQSGLQRTGFFAPGQAMGNSTTIYVDLEEERKPRGLRDLFDRAEANRMALLEAKKEHAKLASKAQLLAAQQQQQQQRSSRAPEAPGIDVEAALDQLSDEARPVADDELMQPAELELDEAAAAEAAEAAEAPQMPDVSAIARAEGDDNINMRESSDSEAPAAAAAPAGDDDEALEEDTRMDDDDDAEAAAAAAAAAARASRSRSSRHRTPSRRTRHDDEDAEDDEQQQQHEEEEGNGEEGEEDEEEKPRRGRGRSRGRTAGAATPATPSAAPSTPRRSTRLAATPSTTYRYNLRSASKPKTPKRR